MQHCIPSSNHLASSSLCCCCVSYRSQISETLVSLRLWSDCNNYLWRCGAEERRWPALTSSLSLQTHDMIDISIIQLISSGEKQASRDERGRRTMEKLTEICLFFPHIQTCWTGNMWVNDITGRWLTLQTAGRMY